MVVVGNEKKNIKLKTDGIIVIICPCYHCWGEIIIYPYFIRLNVSFGLMKKKRIYKFTIEYMIHPGLNVNKTLKKQVEKCMLTIFGAITQPFIKAILLKNNTRVLEVIMFYDTRAYNIAYIVLSCVIYTTIKNYDFIHYLACQ